MFECDDPHPESGRICHAGCVDNCPEPEDAPRQPNNGGEWLQVNGRSGSPEGADAKEACGGNDPVDQLIVEGRVCFVACGDEDQECPPTAAEGTWLEPPTNNPPPSGGDWRRLDRDPATPYLDLMETFCIGQGIEPGEIATSVIPGTDTICFYSCPSPEFFFCPIDGSGVQSKEAPSLEACTESDEVQQGGSPPRCFETQTEAEEECNQFWYCDMAGGLQGPLAYPTEEECTAENGENATDGRCHDNPDDAMAECNQFWICEETTRMPALAEGFFADVGDCSDENSPIDCHETEEQAAADPECNLCEDFLPVPNDNPAWTEMDPNASPPTCPSNERIEFWPSNDVTPLNCAFRCLCDETFICEPPGTIPHPGTVPPNCTLVQQGIETNQCGETRDPCFRLECGESDICPDGDRVCTGAAYIDCKGCVAGSRIDYGGVAGTPGNTIAPQAATRHTGQLCNEYDSCEGGCSCEDQIHIHGNPFIPATNRLANGQHWSSQDFCKIYDPMFVPSTGHERQFFSFNPYDTNRYFHFPFNTSGADDFICSGCNEPPSRFMAGPTHIYATAGRNAGCQRIVCQQKATHGRTNTEMIYRVQGTQCTGNCNAFDGNCVFVPVRTCEGPADTDSTRVDRTWQSGDTCDWREIDLLGGRFRFGERADDPVTCRRLTDTCCGPSNCGCGDGVTCENDDPGCTPRPETFNCCCNPGTTCNAESRPGCCITVWHQHDQFPQSCDTTQIFGRQIQAEWRVIDHDRTNNIWGSGRCDITDNFEISWNRDNGEEACQQVVPARPGESVFLTSSNRNSTVFNPCACKVERYHVTIERENGTMRFQNIQTEDGSECLMRHVNDPSRNTDHHNMRDNGTASSDGFFRLTPRDGMNGPDINGWVWVQEECRFECSGCDDNAHCYGQPPALFDIEFLPDQRTTATYTFTGNRDCFQTEDPRFAIHFNEGTSWVTQQEIESRRFYRLYVPHANPNPPFNYHEWIIQRAGTGRDDGSGSRDVFNVRYSFDIPDGSQEFFRLIDVNGERKCAVRYHNNPQRGSHFDYPTSAGFARSDGYFVINPAANNPDEWWEWVEGANLGDYCEFRYIYRKDREESVSNKCVHSHRVAVADITFEADQRITATYEFRNEARCGQTNHQFGIIFNDSSNWVPNIPVYPAPDFRAGITRWAFHEFIITRAGVNDARNDYQAGSFVNHIPTAPGYGAGDRRFTVAYTWRIPDGSGVEETFRPTMIDGRQFCAIRVHNDPQRNNQYGDVNRDGFARSDGFFIIEPHEHNAHEFWIWNNDECVFEFTGAQERICYHRDRVAQALITFEPDMRLNASYVYDSTNECDDIDEDITIVFNDHSAPNPRSPWTEHRVDPARQMTNYYHELIVNRVETGREDGPAGNTVFTVDYYFRGIRFAPDPRFGGACAVEWFRNPDTDGVDGFGEAWGLAGRNGHLVLEEYQGSTGYQPSNQNEWYFDQANCRFIWNGRGTPNAGRAVHDGIGYDGRPMQKCEQRPLEAVGHIRFVPDLRVVVYNDAQAVSRLNQSIIIGDSEVGLKCAPHGRGVDYRTLARGAWVAQEHRRDGAAIGGSMWLQNNESIFFTNEIRDFSGHLFDRELVNNRLGLSMMRLNVDDPNNHFLEDLPISGVSGTLNDAGQFFTMFPGHNITRGPGAANHPYRIGVDITTNFDRTEDTYYLACVCPSLPDRFATPGANDAMRTGDCVYYFSPVRDLDICTTKRIYVTQRNCYTAAWWQVSGGNVFASQDIISRVPPNIPGNICTGAGREQYCVGTEPDGDGFVRDFENQPFYDYLRDRGDANDGNYRCTPRIIRGRTPCKADGPSNSAGIALTTSGRVVAVDTEDFYVATFTNPSIMAERISERANIHALYQGGNYGNNTLNNLGLQYRIADSKAGPKYGTLGISTGVDNLDTPVPGTGFNPAREDFAYFLSLAGGRGSFEAANRIITPTIGVGGTAASLNFNDVVPTDGSDSICMRVIYHLPGGEVVDGFEPSVGGSNTDDHGFNMTPTINYICYVTPTNMSRFTITGRDNDGNFTEDIIENVLRLTPEDGWHVQTETEDDGGHTYAITQAVKVTVFVEGNLVLDSIPSSNRAVTAVDVGSFLSFIVTGDIIVTQNVGINMPNPRELCPQGITNCAALATCWERQSANLPGPFDVAAGGPNDPDFFNSSMGIGGVAENQQHRSAVGSVEGFFLANGNLAILRFEDLTSCNASNPDPSLDMTGVFTDKRFIGQGIFAAWGTSNFLRDFNQRDRGCQDDTHGVYNNRVPTDTFIYRPDIVRNLPFWMRRASVIYRDITGGFN